MCVSLVPGLSCQYSQNQCLTVSNINFHNSRSVNLQSSPDPFRKSCERRMEPPVLASSRVPTPLLDRPHRIQIPARCRDVGWNAHSLETACQIEPCSVRTLQPDFARAIVRTSPYSNLCGLWHSITPGQTIGLAESPNGVPIVLFNESISHRVTNHGAVPAAQNRTPPTRMDSDPVA